MTDYTELVKALRYCAESGDFKCGKDCPMHTEYPNCLTKMDTDAAAAIEALQAQLPKRGEWVEDTTYAGPDLSNYKCSLCGKICGTWRRGLKPRELPNWCGNCGADMRKMEVQDGANRGF